MRYSADAVAAYERSIHDAWLRLRSIAGILENHNQDLVKVEESVFDEAKGHEPAPADGIGMVLLDVARSMRRASRVLDDSRRDQGIGLGVPRKAVDDFSTVVHLAWIKLFGIAYVVDKNGQRLEFERIKANERTPHPAEGLGLLLLDIAAAIHRASRKFQKAAAADKERLAEARQNRDRITPTSAGAGRPESMETTQ